MWLTDIDVTYMPDLQDAEGPNGKSGPVWGSLPLALDEAMLTSS